MKIAIAGANGFMGKNMGKFLVKKGFEVLGLVRNEKGARIVKDYGGKPFIVDYNDENSIVKAVHGCTVLFHFIGASRETSENSFYTSNVLVTKSLVNACLKAKVKRIIYNSGLGVSKQNNQSYFRSKREAEKVIIDSGLDYTIFRPSYIIGEGDELTPYIVKKIKKGAVEIYGSGQYRMQPIWIEQAAEIYLKCVDNPKTTGKIFDLVGLEKISYIDFLRLCIRILKPKKIIKFSHIPIERAIQDALRSENPSISVDEIVVLVSDTTADYKTLEKIFGIKLKKIEEILKKILINY